MHEIFPSPWLFQDPENWSNPPIWQYILKIITKPTGISSSRSFTLEILRELGLFLLSTGKRGPIYSVQWSPNSKEFCVVYGCILK